MVEICRQLVFGNIIFTTGATVFDTTWKRNLKPPDKSGAQTRSTAFLLSPVKLQWAAVEDGA